MVGNIEDTRLIGAAILFAVAVVLPNWRRTRRLVRRLVRYWRRTWRQGRRRFAFLLPGKPVKRLCVVDGDTVDDPETGIRYRLANIDCPETDDRARCYRERTRGEQAKGAAEIIFSAAQDIELRPTGKIDRYGRTVAFIRVDGRDYGELMIEKGFAQPWNGRRESWCGPGGGLVGLAKTSMTEWNCKTCGGSFVPKRGLPSSVIELPVVYRRTDQRVD